jgi:hypothetical protein
VVSWENLLMLCLASNCHLQHLFSLFVGIYVENINKRKYQNLLVIASTWYCLFLSVIMKQIIEMQSTAFWVRAQRFGAYWFRYQSQINQRKRVGCVSVETTEKLLASHERLGFMELVSSDYCTQPFYFITQIKSHIISKISTTGKNI